MTESLPWLERFPWIDFKFDPARVLGGPTWATLGECSSKIDHVSGTPLRADVGKQMLTVFIAKGVHATTAIEGNTLSEDQVQQRLEGQLSLDLPASQQYQQQEIDNIIAACYTVYQNVEKTRGRPFRLTSDEVRGFNKMILSKLELDPGIVPGKFRDYVVTVSDYRAPDKEYVEPMMDGMCEWLNQGQFRADFGSRYVSAILRAIVAHLYIAWIHPFGDGNGRTARVIEFDILFRAGVPVACAHLLSDHYNRTRSAYYRALSAARQHPLVFVEYAIQGLRDRLIEQIDMIRGQQREVTWNDYIHSIFHKDDDKSAQARRRRELALHLALRKVPVAVDRLTMLTPKLAVMYNGKGPRTLQRDLQALRAKGLIIDEPEGVRANLEMISAFLPYAMPRPVPKKTAARDA